MGVLCLDGEEENQKYSNFFIFAKVDLFVLNQFSYCCRCLFVNSDNKEYLEEYFEKKNLVRGLSQKCLEFPKTSFDLVKFVYWNFHLIFENFFLEEAFFSEENRQTSFFNLILKLKVLFYDMLIFKNDKIEKILEFAVEFFECIFIHHFQILCQN